MLTYHKQRMKTDKSGHALQLLVGRCVLSETSQGYPIIRKEQVRRCVRGLACEIGVVGARGDGGMDGCGGMNE